MRLCLISAVALCFLRFCSSYSYLNTNTRRFSCSTLRPRSKKSTRDPDLESALAESLMRAKECADAGLSPGAGLASADEQSDAAYADLILGSMDQQGIEQLDAAKLEELAQGARMWEPDAKVRHRSFGVLGDLSNLWAALSGGAHIVKNKYGET